MAQTPRSISRGQVALICILAAVLVGVVISNWPSELPVEAELATGVAAHPTGAQPIGKQGAVATGQSKKRWPEFSLEETAAFDPFAAAPTKTEADGGLATSTNQAGAASQAEDGEQADSALDSPSASDLTNEPMRLFLYSRKGAAALVGSQVVRPGEIVDGWEVVGVATEGVQLRRAAP